MRSVDADIRANNAVVSNLNFADIVDGTVSPNDNMVPDGDVVTVITVKGSLHGHMSSNTPNICHGRCLARRDTNGLSWLENVKEQASSFLWRHAMCRGSGEVIKLPASRSATLALQTELFVKGIEMSSRKHLLLLGSPGLELRLSQCHLSCLLCIRARPRGVNVVWRAGYSAMMKKIDLRQLRAVVRLMLLWPGEVMQRWNMLVLWVLLVLLMLRVLLVLLVLLVLVVFAHSVSKRWWLGIGTDRRGKCIGGRVSQGRELIIRRAGHRRAR